MCRSFSLCPRRIAVAALMVTVALAGGCRSSRAQERVPIRVAAASDLAAAFPEAGEAFRRHSGRSVSFTFGSSGLLARQIGEGAPFDVFASADASFVDAAVKSGTCDGTTKAFYGRGRIVLWVARAYGIRVPATVGELVDARFSKIAIANPEHAPYGRAAKQAMERAGIWATVASRIVYGENAQQALQFAQSGNAEVAIVALSSARAKQDGEYVEIDASLHEPLDQAIVGCGRGPDWAGGLAFAAFINGEEGRAIMRRYGFVLPSEAGIASAHGP